MSNETTNSASSNSGSSNFEHVALGVGIGIGLPLLITLAVVALLLIRHRRVSEKIAQQPVQSSNNAKVQPSEESLKELAVNRGAELPTHREAVELAGEDGSS